MAVMRKALFGIGQDASNDRDQEATWRETIREQ
jgi:hypothetical protein